MDTRNYRLKRRDMGLASAIIVIAQVLSNFQSSQSLSKNVSDDILKLRKEFDQARIEHEQFFVKKEELKKVVAKLDSMNSKLKVINKQIEKLSGTDFVKNECSLKGYTDATLIRREGTHKTHSGS